MKPFKFLRRALAKAHDGGYIYPEEVFYTINKEEIRYININGELVVKPKHLIVQRKTEKEYSHIFVPDYDKLWYFRTRENAHDFRDLLEKLDVENKIIHSLSDICSTNSR